MGESRPLFALLLLESFDETVVAVKLQGCPRRDGAGRLRCRSFIATVVVPFF